MADSSYVELGLITTTNRISDKMTGEKDEIQLLPSSR